jgi:CubicO group peptidase (beta-lactamase class C family)
MNKAQFLRRAAANLTRTGLALCLLAHAVAAPQKDSKSPADTPDQKSCVTKPFTWQTATPESQGLSSRKLEALKDELAKLKTRAFLVVRHDRIVYERYAGGHDAGKKQGTASLAKAVVGGLSLAVAISDGGVSLDDPASKWIPAWRHDPLKSKITLRYLGSHTSGIEDAEESRLPHDKLPGWKGDYWKRLDPPRDPFTLSRDTAPALFEPGTRMAYSNPGIGLLTYCVTASRKDQAPPDIRGLLATRVVQPMGIAEAEWSVGYGKTFRVEGLPLVPSWDGASFTPRAMARIGRLLLRQGDWDGQRILSAGSVQAITRDAGLPGHCGMGFWTNDDGRYAKLPKDTYYGAGSGDQLLIVIPSLHLIVVRNGEQLAPDIDNPRDVFEAFHDQRVKVLLEPILDALTAK